MNFIKWLAILALTAVGLVVAESLVIVIGALLLPLDGALVT